MDKKCAVVLAAGEGTRMKSAKPKVLAEVLFKPMIKHVIDSVQKAGIRDICVITGYAREILEDYLHKEYPDVHIVHQAERLGTAHAVSMAGEFLSDHIDSDVFIVGGDSPFVDAETIDAVYMCHSTNDYVATVISAQVENPFGYGRIVRDDIGCVQAIVEQKDADATVQSINEINSGAYWFDVRTLLDVLPRIKSDNAQHEYYLPDAIKLFIADGKSVGASIASNKNVVLGANDCFQLNALNEIARQKVLKKLMLSGVNIPCTDGVVISEEVSFGKNVCIMPGTIIKGFVHIEDNQTVGPYELIEK